MMIRKPWLTILWWIWLCMPFMVGFVAQAAEKPSSPAGGDLKTAVEAFQKNRSNLSPEEAAKAWLALADRLVSKSGADEIDFSQLVSALPDPRSWDALAKEVRARPAATGRKGLHTCTLRVFVDLLMQDQAAFQKDLTALADQARANQRIGAGSFMGLQSITDLQEFLLDSSDDPQMVIRALETRFASHQISDSNFPTTFQIPDLVTLVGEVKARELLKRALVLPQVEIDINVGDRTQELARQLALEMIDQLKSPPWKLVQSISPDALRLYEALDKWFPLKKKALTSPSSSVGLLTKLVGSLLGTAPSTESDMSFFDYSRSEAKQYYLLGLIAANRPKEAITVAKSYGTDTEDEFRFGGMTLHSLHHNLASLDRAGLTKAVHAFFHELLTENPDLPFWGDYVSLSARVGETEPMLKLARTSATRQGLSPEHHAVILKHLAEALLAADRIEEAVNVIQQALSLKAAPSSGKVAAEFQVDRGELALKYAWSGHLLGRKEWVSAGIPIVQQALAEIEKGKNASVLYRAKGFIDQLAELLIDLGRGAEAEKLVKDHLDRMILKSDSQSRRFSIGMGNDDLQGALVHLVKIHHQLGQHGKVLELLDQSSHWGVADLAEIYHKQASGYLHTAKEPPLGYMVAKALAEAGRKSEALKILHAVLQHNAGYDPSCELLLQLEDSSNVLAYLDRLFQSDPFEERPLIWKAEVLLKAGRLKEAEEAAKQAIAIDPSDGEQGPGHRMQVYAVMARIRAAQGNAKEAEFFERVVQAVRLAEKADRFYKSGLLTRGIKMYEEALTYFADAYCIQSRLAVQLSDAGRHEEAAQHYRRAYELMPDSFGRMESHCFGCEGVFRGQAAQSIAERVFSELVAKMPQKPQVHYLLGYLRENQRRYPEALSLYRAAVKLDTDYVNAWKHIQELAKHIHLPVKDRDEAVFHLLKLDPNGRHVSVEMDRVCDLKGLWSVVESAKKDEEPEPTELYTLKASKAALDKNMMADPFSDRIFVRFHGRLNRGYQRLGSPGQAISGHKVIEALSELLQPVESPGF